MELSKTECAIGLYAHNQDDPGASFYARFYSLVLEQLAKVGVEPTYIGGTGTDYPERYVKFGGRAHKTLMAAGFEDIEGLSFAANPPGSDAPGYDSFLVAAAGCVISGFPQSKGKEVHLRFVINESFLPFGTDAFDRVLLELIDLHPWDFGLGFSDTVERHPDLYLACFSHEKLAPEERSEGNTIWYSTPPEVRLIKLRSIYPYNIINERQLAQEAEPGVSLRDFIKRRSIGTLEPLPGGRLWLWKVPDHDQRVALRRQLQWKVADWRQLARGQIDWNQSGIVIDAATLIP